MIDKDRSDRLKTGPTKEVEDDSDGVLYLVIQRELILHERLRELFLYFSAKYTSLGLCSLFQNSTCWSYKMCEVYLTDKTYGSLH